jgi:hypothetical protein
MEGLTPDQVEQELLATEAIIARVRARQLELTLLADRMQLPTADGSRSSTEWLAARLDVAPESSRVIAAAAHRLEARPDLIERLRKGEVSFDRAVVLSRIPETIDSRHLDGHDISGLRRIAARSRRLERVDEHLSYRAQHLTLQPNLDESRWDVWGSLDGYGGAVVSKVLSEEADRIPNAPDGSATSIGHRRALALTRICEDRHPGTDSHPLITLFVDGTGVEIEAGPTVGRETLDKVACAGSLEVVNVRDGQPLAMGRRSRVISGKLRRFVMHRDGGCAVDGCTSRYRLQAHHIVPWSEGGPTDPDNLTTLCWFHHHVVIHGWGYRIDPSLGPSRLRFTRPGHDPPR